MSLYLQMDGIDDYIKLPSMTLTKIVADVKIRRRTDFNRVIWDFRTGIGFSYLQQTTGGLDTWGSGTLKVDTVTKTNNTVAIPHDTRCIVEHTLSAGTDDGNIFNNNSNTANTFISGDIFNIKIYNGATLQAHYDMTTGTLLDQSGNGRNATLTGGTWLDDGSGGAGTDGTTAFDLKQTLFQDATTANDSKQVIYNDSAIASDTKQMLYQDSAITFDTIQELFESGTMGAISFDLLVKLYSDGNTQNDLKQTVYSDSATAFDTLQEIFNSGVVGSTPFDLRVVLYNDNEVDNDVIQSFYQDGLIDFDTMIRITEGEPIFAVIRLKGKQVLGVNLVGQQQNGIHLKGLIQ